MKMMEWFGDRLNDRLFLLLLATYGAVLVGGPRWLHQMLGYGVPAHLWRTMLGVLESRLNRAHRPKQDRQFRGGVVLLVLSMGTLVIGCGISIVTLIAQWGWYAELAILIYLLPVRAAMLPVRALSWEMKHKRYAQVQRHLAPLTDADVAPLDTHGYLRCTLAYIARAFPAYVVVPSCWYLLAGLPGMMLVRLLGCMYEAWPASHKRYRAFTLYLRWWYHLLYAVPTRIAFLCQWIALLMVPQSFFSGGVQALLPRGLEAAMTTVTMPLRLCAYGLKVSLGGPYQAGGEMRKERWIGQGRARVIRADVTRARLWYGCSCLLWMITLSLVFLYTT
ncbi:MAG: hypothetical protein F6K62_10220 [Sphaerospermopsis sp. SIO1G2]|nr:hypothetical protein [Sphaerospermopsis sp. SIO1G2]